MRCRRRNAEDAVSEQTGSIERKDARQSLDQLADARFCANVSLRLFNFTVAFFTDAAVIFLLGISVSWMVLILRPAP
jgi:hypothetical protein